MRPLSPFALLAGLAIPAPLQAHPHSTIDQQVLFSVGTSGATLRVVIMPSSTEGAAIFAHIDSDGDGIASDREVATFAARLASQLQLSLDGASVPLGLPKGDVPGAADVAAGSGMIIVTTAASYAPLDQGPHEMTLRVSYEDLSHDWFIQPFLQEALLDRGAPPGISRSDGGRLLTLRLGAN